jgi:aryl-alcohol dehydrogenase-like predicted oxidoreductase
MDYGVSRSAGRPGVGQVQQILRLAAERGVVYVDTAPAYGESEAVLGQALWPDHPFRVVTKTPVFRGAATAAAGDAVRQAFIRSLTCLRQSRCYGLLVHHADDLLAEGGEHIFDAVARLKGEGLCSKIGASVYDGAQIDRILERFSMDLVQLPLSLLDQRLVHSRHLETLQQQGIEIHARSVFLQGLMLMNPTDLHEYFEPIRRHLADYDEHLRQRGVSRLEAAIGFVERITQVDAILCGVESPSQLDQIHAAFLAGVRLDDSSRFRLDDPRFVNPARWPVAATGEEKP